MNVLILNGSARKNGFCDHIAVSLKEALEKLNIEVNYYNIPDKNINFCKGCVKCCADENKYCFIQDDIQEAYKLFEQSGSFVYISPVYESFISGILKNFFDRTNHYTSFFKLAGKNMNLILSGAQPLYGKTKEFSNIHVVRNVNRYFANYSIITHTQYNYLGFFHNLNHHTSKNEGKEKEFNKQIEEIAQKISKQRINYEMVEKSKTPYSV